MIGTMHQTSDPFYVRHTAGIIITGYLLALALSVWQVWDWAKPNMRLLAALWEWMKMLTTPQNLLIQGGVIGLLLYRRHRYMAQRKATTESRASDDASDEGA
jgi:hypothetical protein